LQLAQNNNTNHLHGGKVGWGKKLFSGPQTMNRNGRESVLFTYKSLDGEEGYPGTVELRVWYASYEAQEDGVSKLVLEIEYEVEMTGDECDETTVGITNHRHLFQSCSLEDH
jgi:aldose 1-epimerase